MPDDTVLIEYVSYRPFFVRNKRAEAYGARRYAAYVLRRDGIANSVDLGDAAAIEQNVNEYARLWRLRKTETRVNSLERCTNRSSSRWRQPL